VSKSIVITGASKGIGRAGAGNGKVGGVPLGTVRGEETDAVAGLNAEFDKGGRKAGNAAEKLLGRDGLPAAGDLKHLRAGIGQMVDGVEKARGEGAVVHVLALTLPYRTWLAQCSDFHDRSLSRGQKLS